MFNSIVQGWINYYGRFYRSELLTFLRRLNRHLVRWAIARLNPIVRGWAAYYRTGVSSRIFSTIDAYVWWLTFRWARRTHSNKPKRWIHQRYYGPFHPARRDSSVFGDRGSGAFLTKLAWTPISDDGSVLLWDISDRANPAAIGDSLIPPGVESRTRVAFDPHGRLYAASRDGTIRIFNLETDNTKRICASTRNVLTEQRWNQILPSLPYNPPCR